MPGQGQDRAGGPCPSDDARGRACRRRHGRVIQARTSLFTPTNPEYTTMDNDARNQLMLEMMRLFAGAPLPEHFSREAFNQGGRNHSIPDLRWCAEFLIGCGVIEGTMAPLIGTPYIISVSA